MDSQSRKYQLTINNPPPEWTHDKIKCVSSVNFKTLEFLAMCDEIGSEGTKHTHAFVCFTSAVRFSTMKKQFPTAHIEKVKGTVKDNIDYLKKQGKWDGTDKSETSVGGSYEELGDRPTENKGNNHAMQELYKMVVDEGLKNWEIIAINQDYIPMLDKIDRLRMTYLQEKFRGERRIDLEVTYVYGVTGAGKSRDVLDEFKDENVYRVTDYTHPWDGYQTEPVVCFEEFRSSLSISDMLNYLDIYPVQLKARYVNKYACYEKVFITTNLPLEGQYPELQVVNKESWNAFLRRISRVRVYTAKGKYTEYESVEAYLERNTPFTLLQLDEGQSKKNKHYELMRGVNDEK